MSQDLCRNLPPLVRAGGNQGAYGIRLPHVLTLQGEVHDDGPPERLTSEWTVLSGPAPVTFADASSPVTDAVFTDPGTYVLQLAASDGFTTSADRATITVDPEPSLTGASLSVVLGAAGPLNTGATETLTATLVDAQAHPIADFPIQVTVAGANAQTGTVTTNSSGVATFAYVGAKVGTDVLSATALGTTQLTSTSLSVTWNVATSGAPAVTQGWIGAPTHQSTVTGQVPVTVGAGVTLVSGTLTYWPTSAPDQVHTLAASVSGAPGAVLATLDTTTLANGPYIIRLDATNDAGQTQTSLAAVTVSGDYKPGRLMVDVNVLTISLPGMPLMIGRHYDSLEKDNVSDFGHGWSLAMSHPRLESDPAHNVTLTMPNGRRVTFYFTPQSFGGVFNFFYGPKYTPEAGVYGSLTSDGCPLLLVAGGTPVCFLEGGLEYTPSTYTYTDPYGTAYVMGATGELRSITDRQRNSLVFSASGITSTVAGMTVHFDRDTQGRITTITSPEIDASASFAIDTYEYDANGDLITEKRPASGSANVGVPLPTKYTYTAHRLTQTIDARGSAARTSTYDSAGRLLTDTDALNRVTSYAYDLGTRTTRITNPDGGVVTQVFDDRGLLLTEVDPLGRTTAHEYDANRNETRRTNALGEAATFGYDAQGNQTSVTNARNEVRRTTYNAFSEPLTSTDPLGHVTTFDYDDNGLPTRFADEIGTLSTFTSSEHGLPLTVKDAAGNTRYLTYDAAGNMITSMDRLGRVTQNTYDGIGRLSTTTDPRGNVRLFTYLVRGPLFGRTDGSGLPGHDTYGRDYDANDNLTDEYSSEGRTTIYQYDVTNYLTKVAHPDNTTTKFTGDFRGNKLTETDEANRTTTYQYDLAGQLVQTTYPDGTFSKRGYDALGRLSSTTDEHSNTTTYEYQAGCGCSERLTKVTDPLGHATTTAYDANGRRSSVTDANGHTTNFIYDVRGHVIETDYADGTTTHDGYDTVGRHTSTTDQTGAVTQYGYDAEGQLTSVTDVLNHVTQYGYDASGNLTTVTDAKNHVTTYTFDPLNRETSRKLPLGMTETFAYNMYGNNTSHVDFRLKTATYTYDLRGRLLTKVPDSSLGEPTVTFTYNPTGTRATMADASGSTSYTYDARDRLLTKATPAGALTYTWDPVGNLATIRSSNTNGTSVDYTWDAANQLHSVQDNRAGGITTDAYTATGRTDTLSQPTGVTATYTYSPVDRVISLAWQRGSSPAFASWAYTYNSRGQRLTSTEVSGRTATYGYDAVARLTSETIAADPRGALGNGALAYGLDAVGNRLSRASTLAALPSQNFGYDFNDQLTSDGYDANGNTVTSGGSTYAYDFENRLVSKNSGAVVIVYDGDGNRVAKTVGGVTTKYLVDDLNPTGYVQALEEVSGGTVQVRYTYGSSVVSQARGSVVNFYGYDAHGNVAFLTDATGAVTDTYEYDAWGNLVGQTGSTTNTRLYAGEEWDPDLGLLNLRARQYRPAIGRFTTIDQVDSMFVLPARPLRVRPELPYDAALLDMVGLSTRLTGERLLTPTGLGRFMYASGDPVNRMDPAGLSDATEYEGELTVPQQLRRQAQRVGGKAACALERVAALMDCWITLKATRDVAANDACYAAAEAAYDTCVELALW
jgi:RHS repeat-associated protein